MNYSVVSYLSHYDKLKPTLEGSIKIERQQNNQNNGICVMTINTTTVTHLIPTLLCWKRIVYKINICAF